jgi:hypothetical protein
MPILKQLPVWPPFPCCAADGAPAPARAARLARPGRAAFFLRPGVVVLGVFLLCAAAFAADPGEECGKVLTVTNNAWVERNGQRIPLAAHSPIHPGDAVITDATGRVRILCADDTALQIGSDTTFVVDNYREEEPAAMNLSLPQGMLRVMTGGITRMNPEGFSITTPEATVGIRGSILTVERRKDRTRLFCENTNRQVFINAVNVPGGHTAIVSRPGDRPVIVPIQPDDRRMIGRELAFAGGAAAAASAPEPGRGEIPPDDVPQSQEGPALAQAEPAVEPPLVSLPLQDMTARDIASPAKPLAAEISGMAGGGGSFGFNLNLQNGDLSNGRLNIPMPPIGYGFSADLSGGGGSATASGWNISGMSGTYVEGYPGWSTFSGSATGSMFGGQDLLSLPSGGTVTGNFTVTATSGGFSGNTVPGALSGTLRK